MCWLSETNEKEDLYLRLQMFQFFHNFQSGSARQFLLGVQPHRQLDFVGQKRILKEILFQRLEPHGRPKQTRILLLVDLRELCRQPLAWHGLLCHHWCHNMLCLLAHNRAGDTCSGLEGFDTWCCWLEGGSKSACHRWLPGLLAKVDKPLKLKHQLAQSCSKAKLPAGVKLDDSIWKCHLTERITKRWQHYWFGTLCIPSTL